MIRHRLIFILASLSLFSVSPAHTKQPQAPATQHSQPIETHDAAATETFPTQPRKTPDGQRWRLAYVESGIYTEYPLTLRAVISGLEQLGWVTLADAMPEDITGEALWQWLGQHTQSDYLEFAASAYWRPGNFDTDQRVPMRENILEYVNKNGDLDLILAMGTWAGQDMRAIGPPIPTVVTSTSDPLSSGIIDSIHDSGKDNLHARVEPQRYQRQLRLFHEIVPFDNLGIVYEDSDAGRTYVALDAIEEISAELGFDITHCHAESSNISGEQAAENAVNCFQTLADQHVEAVYITSHQGVTLNSIVDIAKILRDAGIPSFSMTGADDVKRGILLSLAQANVSYVGLFHAEAIARILNGATPRSLDQVWIDPAKIALNLATARIIGFDPPIDILLAADEVYESPQDR